MNMKKLQLTIFMLILIFHWIKTILASLDELSINLNIEDNKIKRNGGRKPSENPYSGSDYKRDANSSGSPILYGLETETSPEQAQNKSSCKISKYSIWVKNMVIKMDNDKSGSLSKYELMSWKYWPQEYQPLVHMIMESIVQRLIVILDENGDGEVDRKEIAIGICQMQKERVKFIFKFFNTDNDEYVSNKELLDLLKKMKIKSGNSHMTEPQLQPIVDNIMLFMDTDDDGYISFERMNAVFSKEFCFEFDIHHVGGGLIEINSDIKYGVIGSAESCQLLCQSTDGCTWFNWISSKDACTIKAEKGNKIVSHPGDVTGPRHCTTKPLDTDDEKWIAEILKFFDTDKSGSISVKELPQMLQKNPLILRLMSLFDEDSNGDQEIEKYELKQGISLFKTSRLKFEMKFLDFDNNGVISPNELHHVLKQMRDNGMFLNLKHVSLHKFVLKIITILDYDKSGTINVGDFFGISQASIVGCFFQTIF